MAGHSRPKDGVASARLCPTIDLFGSGERELWLAPNKPGQDNSAPLTFNLPFGEKGLRTVGPPGLF
jgi:hypothetical protein